MIVETRGIVISEAAQGEKGKRLLIYTKDFGKITCFTKNTHKKNTAVATLLSYSDLKMYQNKTSYQLIDGMVLRSFEGVKTDIYKLSYAMYLLEFLDVIGREELEGRDALKLVLYALRALEVDKVPDSLVKTVFDLKIMQILGFEPALYGCVLCGEEEVSRFSCAEGGAICSSCNTPKDIIKMDKNTLEIMRYILETPVEKLFSFDLKESQKFSLKKLMEDYLRVHIGHRFKTMDFLTSL